MLDSETSEKLVTVTAILEESAIPYAVGGAVVLIYCAEPRGTIDIDVNIFLPADSPDATLQAMQRGIEFDVDSAAARVRRDGQVRIDYLGTKLDLFFANTQFHKESGRRTHRVPFEGRELNILSCADLVVYKAMFNRRKDWADIESVLHAQASNFDLDYARGWLVAMVGESDERVRELDKIVAEVAAAEAADASTADS